MSEPTCFFAWLQESDIHQFLLARSITFEWPLLKTITRFYATVPHLIYSTFGSSRFMRMSGSWIEYLALISNLMTPTSKTQPDPHMHRCHAPLPPGATIQLIYGLLLFAGTWRDDTKNRKNASSQGFCTPGCHLCYHHKSDESSTFWKYDFQII